MKTLSLKFFELVNSKLDRKNRIIYSVYAVEKALETFEKNFPNSDEARIAIDSVRKCIEDDTSENISSAKEAALQLKQSVIAAPFIVLHLVLYNENYHYLPLAVADAVVTNLPKDSDEQYEAFKEILIDILKYGIKLVKGNRVKVT